MKRVLVLATVIAPGLGLGEGRGGSPRQRGNRVNRSDA